MSLVFLLRSSALYLYILFATAVAAHISVPIAASGHVFVAKVTVGTPPQSLSLLLSPSSPHTWLPKSEAMPCMTGFNSLSGFHSPEDGMSGSACKWGAFSASKSSTAKNAEQVYLDFVVAYTDTINVSGLNMTDKFNLADIQIDDFSLGLVDSSSSNQWIGMLGLGNDATTLFPRPSSRYRPNLIDRLVSSGKINSPAYSIWLDDAQGKSGSLLLGAIDTSRYEGELARLNTALPYDAFPSAFAVSLANVKTDDSPSKQDFKYDGPSLRASLSPAETFSYLPDALVDGIITASGATWNTSLQRATIRCDAGTKSPETTLRFQLEGPSGPVLKVRLADLVVPQEVTSWETAFATLNPLARNTCLFGIQKYPDLRSNSNPQYNIGSSLLRRTYMVFDAANKEVALAPAKFGSSDPPAIVPFDKAAARIPSSKLYCAPGNEECLDSASALESGIITAVEEPKSKKNWKTIIIAVVVPLTILAIAIPIAYVFYMRRRRQRQERERQEWAVRGKQSESSIDDVEDNFQEDEFGVKVTVSVTAKVSERRVPPPLSSPNGSSLGFPPPPSPSPSGSFLGLPGGPPSIPEERKSQYSGKSGFGAGSDTSEGSWRNWKRGFSNWK